MLKSIISSVIVVFAVAAAFVGVKWAMEKLNLTPQKVYELNRAERELASVRAEGEKFDALVELELARDRHDKKMEGIEKARKDAKKAKEEAAKEKKAA